MQLKFTFQHILCLVVVLLVGTHSIAQISIPNGAFTDSQDFSTLANTGTSSTVPTGWAFFETAANANALYTAGTGGSNAGDTYSFGLAANIERAFGGLQSGNLNPTVGVCYTNNTGNTINGLTVSYTGETWRVGAAARTDGMQFQYNQNTTAINGAGTWTSFNALDYFNPGQATGSGSMLHSALISSPITGLSIAPGATFCFRWNDFNASGSDDGLAVDDFSLNAALAVTLADFTAQQVDDFVRVTWETASELGNAGFNLYRSDDAAGPQTLLAYQPSQAPGSAQGFAYSYDDAAVQPGQTWWYWLEDVSLNGATTLHGPVSATVQAPTAVQLSSVSASPAAGVAGLPWLIVVAGAGVALALGRRR